MNVSNDTGGAILRKGGEGAVLRKGGRNLRRVDVGLGWLAQQHGGHEFDLDASAILLTADNVVPNHHWFVFFNNEESPDGSVRTSGDDLTGSQDADAGDAETLSIDLEMVRSDIMRIIFPVSIYDADLRKQSFGQVRNAYIRVVDVESDMQIARYDLTNEAGDETALVFAELVRKDDGSWEFRAVGQKYASGLTGIARQHGVKIAS